MNYLTSVLLGLIFCTSVLSLPAGEDAVESQTIQSEPAAATEAVPTVAVVEEKKPTEAAPAQVTVEAEKTTLANRFAEQNPAGHGQADKEENPPLKGAAPSLSHMCPIVIFLIAVLIFGMN